jgi:hypothetical protein
MITRPLVECLRSSFADHRVVNHPPRPGSSDGAVCLLRGKVIESHVVRQTSTSRPSSRSGCFRMSSSLTDRRYEGGQMASFADVRLQSTSRRRWCGRFQGASKGILWSRLYLPWLV